MNKQLFKPIKIGAVTCKNRIAYAATGMGTAAPDGSVTDQTLCHYVARSMGGAGWIIVECSTCTNRYGTGMLCFHSDYQLRGLRDLADAIHAFGAIAIVQLGLGNPVRLKVNPVAPSPLPYRVEKGSAPRGLKWMEGFKGAVPRELTITEVEELEGLYTDSAERIKKAGFDGIEIHGAHGHLLAQFVSTLTNKRTDKYGGSFDSRLTLPRNIIRKVRERLGPDFVLGYRISGDEHVPGGLCLEDTKRIIRILIAEGLDFVHLSSGCNMAMKYVFPEEEGMILPEARAIKEVSEVPVICPNIHTPALARKAIAEGQVDMVSLSRSLIADPDWPNKVREGQEDRIQKCIRCNSCISNLYQSFGTRCAVNPSVGKERFIARYYPPVSKATVHFGNR